MAKKLTIEEVKEIAMKNYEKGGDVIIECWDDEDIADWIKREGTRKALKETFKLYNSYFTEIGNMGF